MLGYLWQVSRGYRLRPWKSPYLRWRIETYFGIPADSITFRTFSSIVFLNRGDLVRFLRWAERMRSGAA